MVKRAALAFMLIASVACGKSEAEKAAEAVTEAQAKGGDTAAGMADMAKAMQGMAAAIGGGGTGDGKPVEPVSTDTLKGTLPTVAGWTMEAPEAERMTSPIAFSQVEATFKKGDAEVEVKIVDTGFPVHPVFSQLQPMDATDVCAPFRVLYFPTAQLSFLRRHARDLLETSPAVCITIVLGRNVRRLYPKAREIKDQYPGRVRLIGWTRRVPQLLNQHHLVIGKAGGATVHEAIAARCPMLIHHLVPGQEEGNLRLLESIGAGSLADAPGDLGNQLSALLSDQAAGWRAMKHALGRHDRNAGAIIASRFILKKTMDRGS